MATTRERLISQAVRILTIRRLEAVTLQNIAQAIGALPQGDKAEFVNAVRVRNSKLIGDILLKRALLPGLKAVAEEQASSAFGGETVDIELLLDVLDA